MTDDRTRALFEELAAMAKFGWNISVRSGPFCWWEVTICLNGIIHIKEGEDLLATLEATYEQARTRL